MESKYFNTDGIKIHYQTCGSGPSTLLLIHGAVGSIKDFTLQMADNKLSLDKDEFTIVAFDLPGFGRSEIFPDITTDPTVEYFKMSAQIGANLMHKLNYRTYSVGGWDDGARVASLLAIQHQSRVSALLLWGFVPMMDKQSTDAIARTRDTTIWNPIVLEFYTSVYGRQNFSDLWHKYVDFMVSLLDMPDLDQFDIRNDLCKIKCPTLVLYGTNDPIVSFNRHVKPVEAQIYNSDTKQFKGMAHNIHQADPYQFNQVLTTFVTSVRA